MAGESTQLRKPQPEWGIKLSKFFVIPQRVIVSIMGFFAIVNAYTMRISLSITLTELVVKKNNTSSDLRLPDLLDSELPKGGSFDWSEELQGFILGSFYIGYIITHIPGGMLADRFGAKWVLSLGILATAICTVFTPMAINLGGSTALIISRILMGLSQGTTFPALTVLLANWVPIKERGKLGTLVLGGGQIGTILSNLLSGFLLDIFAWPVVFYFFGALGFLWFVIFVFLCFNDPASTPFIKPSELDYLEREIGSAERNKNLPPTPWKAILTNFPMIAVVWAQVGHDWGFFIMVTDLPKYMADVMQFSIKANGVYTSLPYVLMWITSIAAGFIADWMITTNIMNVTNVRKMMTTFAAVIPGILMVAASYAGYNRIAVVILFTLCMGSMGPYYAGMKLSPLDMSPNYAGTLTAITNGIGAITGVIAPYLAGFMTPNASLLEWRMVFWVAFVVLTVTAIIYGIWASGEIQDFNDPKPDNKDQKIERVEK